MKTARVAGVDGPGYCRAARMEVEPKRECHMNPRHSRFDSASIRACRQRRRVHPCGVRCPFVLHAYMLKSS
jgi:hypothetical protein